MCHAEKVKTFLTHTYTPIHPSFTNTFGTARGGAYNPGYIVFRVVFFCCYVHVLRVSTASKITEQFGNQYELGWLVVLGFNATLTAKVISWRSVTHMCFLAFSHQY